MFTVNGETWNIKFVDPYDNMLLTPNGRFTVGSTDDVTKTIYLSNELSGDFLKKVLTHEIIHAYIFSYNIYLDIMQEEMICDMIASDVNNILQIVNTIDK